MFLINRSPKVSNSNMQIIIELPRVVADALQRVADRSGDEVIDLVVEAVRSSPMVQRALAQSYPREVNDVAFAEVRDVC